VSDKASTKLYCLVTKAHVCEQLAQGCYLIVHRAGVELATSGLQVRHATVTLPSHTIKCGLLIKRDIANIISLFQHSDRISDGIS